MWKQFILPCWKLPHRLHDHCHKSNSFCLIMDVKQNILSYSEKTLTRTLSTLLKDYLRINFIISVHRQDGRRLVLNTTLLKVSATVLSSELDEC